ncbi:phosphoribosylformylglycinamidine cyclo-ligase [Nicoliella spurrieriana]|uniref:Phosphoribosylformylglycinamidine cyclo-ligase n=1 Tax=Nicoliella spurrieriana TaxID=2925830 RepID=A0A976X5J6_9LACO|nr:phosphoribosylformylglycinamidine cyclo-ligase [Nicoliella spurrieriana]UQS86744.1 phosphoribosylformylglycinamidine cyclo-ligase [Nicoliella spurrieriana]
MADQYKQAGVDIESGAKAVDQIKSIVRATQDANVIGGIGGFGAEYSLKDSFAKFKNPVLISGTDGVGTKLLLAIQADRHTTIGIDLVAMCANDILAQGAEPLFFLDYVGIGKLNPTQIKAIVSGVADGCKQAGLSLIGGEMAEMPGIYTNGDYDLSGFAVGIGDKDELLGADKVQAGDVLIGLASSGVHSNGFSLVRKIIQDAKLDVNQTYPGFEQPLIDALLAPTKLYYHAVNPSIQADLIHSIAHITGGGIADNLSRSIPDNLTAQIDRTTWTVPHLFKALQEWGHLDTSDMDQVFNQGIGMVLVVPPSKVAAVQANLKAQSQTYYQIGKVVNRNRKAVEIN